MTLLLVASSIVGTLLLTIVTIAIYKLLFASEENYDQPNHGDRRIVYQHDKYYIQKYSKYPGWVYSEIHDTIESAKVSKARWDKVSGELTVVE